MTTRVDDDVIVYGDIGQSLVFIPKTRAIKLAAIHAALWGSKTWGELHARMPEGEYERVLDMTGDDRMAFAEFLEQERKDRPALTAEEARIEYRALELELRDPEPDGPFEAGNVGPISDGDYPDWPAQEMLDWVPPLIQREYGRRGFSNLNGDLLELPSARTGEIVAALQAHGYQCERGDDLVRRASGYGGGNDRALDESR